MALTQRDLDAIEELINEKLDEKIKGLPTKNEFYSKMDEVIGELKSMREEFTLIVPRVSGHEERIAALEEIHPQGTHI